MSEWERVTTECVVCPGCAFTFSADHTTQATGEYDCPVCDEAKNTARLARAHAALRAMGHNHKHSGVTCETCREHAQALFEAREGKP